MNERSESLDLIRGMAALFVMFGHLRSIFFVPFDQLLNAGIINKAFYVFTGYGHECVIIFFVLSGYFVGSAFHRNFSSSPLGNHIVNYAVNRMARLWVVLLPALIFTAIIDNAGLSMTADKSIYTTGTYYSFIHPSNDRNIVTFLGNVFFLQTIVVPTFGTNSPLWSLANEFWYYLLFPALYVIFTRRVSTTIRLLIGAAVILVLYWLGTRNMPLVEGLLVWLLGFGTYITTFKPGTLIRALCIIAFAAVFLIVRVKPLPMTDLILGVSTALLIISVRDRSLGAAGRVAGFLSKISYTLYLVHLPLIIFISATLLFGKTFRGNLTGMLFFAGLSAFVIGVSYLFYYLFERNTDRVRAIFRQLIAG